MPGVLKIERLVYLLASGERRDDSLRKKMVFEVVEIVGITEEKIPERKSRARDTRQGSEARLAGYAKIKSAAGDIGLRVVIPADFELKTNVYLVVPTQHGDAGRQIILRVAVLNVALTLRTHDIVREIRNTGSRRSPHFGRNNCVVTCRPANRGQIKSGIFRAAVISEPRNAGIKSKYSCWCNSVGVAGRDGVTVIVLRTAICA